MLHQPDPNGQPDMLKGLIAIRKMHMKVLEQTGFSSADELLYPENYYYLSDILSYAAIGARSVEDQQHRLIASGLDVPVGMKNPTSGDLSVMMNSILAAQHPHTFLFAQWEVHSKGNPLAHAILRGSVNKYGRSLPNPKLAFLMTLCLFSLAGIPPFAGFFSRFFVFMAAFKAGFHLLVFIALVNTVISLYYYLLLL